MNTAAASPLEFRMHQHRAEDDGYEYHEFYDEICYDEEFQDAEGYDLQYSECVYDAQHHRDEQEDGGEIHDDQMYDEKCSDLQDPTSGPQAAAAVCCMPGQLGDKYISSSVAVCDLEGMD